MLLLPLSACRHHFPKTANTFVTVFSSSSTKARLFAWEKDAGSPEAMKSVNPVVKDLLLIGGGHAHVAVLKAFGMDPLQGVRITLISTGESTPYSGMIPGLIAGHYRHREAHIDLFSLCQFAGAQFYRASVVGIDLENRRVELKGRPPAAFDLFSVNTGSTPSMGGVPGAAEFALPAKPIERFLEGWKSIVECYRDGKERGFRLVIVGGGAGGVELALSMQHRLRTVAADCDRETVEVEVHLITMTEAILPTHNRRVRSKFARLLKDRGIQVHTNHRVVRVGAEEIHCDPGSALPYDFLIWVTQASAPQWIRASGLSTDPDGFLVLNERLQSVSHPYLFAAGDVAAVLSYKRPKSGVFAVRQGPALARNLRLVLQGKRPIPFRPQRDFLSLISTGDRYAVASRGHLACEGAWVWKWKDWIDRRWMKRYQELPRMSEDEPDAANERELASNPLRAHGLATMRCAGCGGKAGATTLARALDRVVPIEREEVIMGMKAFDDAAVTALSGGRVQAQTVDFFRAFIPDPYLFGKITAEHCLNDLFAMGADPQWAQALATIPLGSPATMEEQLFQVLSGAVVVLNHHRVALTGGHTSEGEELVFGLVVTGVAADGQLTKKEGLRPGDAIILTKPLGTGVLLAAASQGSAGGDLIYRAVDEMLLSNRQAAETLRRYRASACTDVTGFGLIGHLDEMLQYSEIGVDLRIEQIPFLRGAVEFSDRGVASSLFHDNARREYSVRTGDSLRREARYKLLYDPQTAGGLLAGVPAAGAPGCVKELRELGYIEAAIIGTVGEIDRGAVDSHKRISVS